MNIELANAAIAAITDPEVEAGKGWCSRFVRQVSEKAFGKRYAYLFGSSAKHTSELFKAAGFAVEPDKDFKPQVGDILFKTHAGSFGHVGIYVGQGRVAENSSTRLGRVQGAKGYRTLAQYGPYDRVGRIPAPKPVILPTPKPLAVEIDGKKAEGVLINGASYVRAIDVPGWWLHFENDRDPKRLTIYTK